MQQIEAESVEKMLSAKLLELGKSNTLNKLNIREPAKPASSLTFGMFVQVLLQYHLKQHERYIGIFHQKFQQLDIDNNSSLKTVGEFEQLLQNIHLQDQDDLYKELINKIDPFGHGKFSFSEAV